MNARGAIRSLLITTLSAASYGFAIGASKNLLYAWRSAIKFPLLLLGTAALCAIAYAVTAHFLGLPIAFARVQRLAFAMFRGLAILLASLAPATLFFGRTMARPDGTELAGYPAFVALNMGFIAIAGATALLYQSRLLLSEHALAPRRRIALITGWLGLSLLVGGQLAFWLRPFFGIASLHGAPPFALGAEPTVTGATNFYEVVWQFVTRTGRLVTDGR